MMLCEKHIGEPFPPRCAQCDLETLQAANAVVRARLDRNPPDRVREVHERVGLSAAALHFLDPERTSDQLPLDFEGGDN